MGMNVNSAQQSNSAVKAGQTQKNVKYTEWKQEKESVFSRELKDSTSKLIGKEYASDQNSNGKVDSGEVWLHEEYEYDYDREVRKVRQYFDNDRNGKIERNEFDTYRYLETDIQGTKFVNGYSNRIEKQKIDFYTKLPKIAEIKKETSQGTQIIQDSKFITDADVRIALRDLKECDKESILNNLLAKSPFGKVKLSRSQLESMGFKNSNRCLCEEGTYHSDSGLRIVRKKLESGGIIDTYKTLDGAYEQCMEYDKNGKLTNIHGSIGDYIFYANIDNNGNYKISDVIYTKGAILEP